MIMTEERKIKAALKVEASQIRLPSDFLERVNRQADGVAPVRPSLWSRLRLGPKVELAAACLLLIGLVGLAAVRNLNHMQAPAGSDNGSGPHGVASKDPTIDSQVHVQFVKMLTEKTGWLLGQVAENKGVVLNSEAGDSQWSKASPEQLLPDFNADSTFSEHFLDDKIGWIAASSRKQGASTDTITIARTTDAGRTWAKATLSSSDTGKLFLQFTDPQHGWLLIASTPSAGLMQKTLYVTKNGGATWNPVVSQDKALPASGFVTGMQFRDSMVGWVSMLYRDTADIPLYRTQDGGITWQLEKLPIPPTYQKNHYANAYPPSFDGKRGMFLVQFVGADKVFLAAYQTADGGTSWKSTTPIAAQTPRSGLISSISNALNIWVMGENGDKLFVSNDAGQTWNTVTISSPVGSSVIELNVVSDKVGWLLRSSDGHTELLRTNDSGHSWVLVNVAVK
jgi:photosystem II stability/assembly factor-like uncharacterized protein